jgi:hypothetical protein
MRGRIVFLLAAGAIAGLAANEWDNLKRVTHGRSYGFALRDGTCVTGKIASVGEDSVKIKPPSAATLKRPDVVRVTDGGHVYNVVYSSESSWSDVAGIPPRTTSYLRVVTKDGKQHEGSAGQVGDSEITLDRKGKIVKISKSDVARVYYVRQKPLSDSAAFHDEEHFLLDPELWPYYWNIGVHMPVLLYDSAEPENNSKIACSVSQPAW